MIAGGGLGAVLSFPIDAPRPPGLRVSDEAFRRAIPDILLAVAVKLHRPDEPSPRLQRLTEHEPHDPQIFLFDEGLHASGGEVVPSLYRAGRRILHHGGDTGVG